MHVEVHNMNAWSTSEEWFKSWDGTDLFYRTWQTPSAGKNALIVIHRGHEHTGRLTQQIEDLNLPDFKAFSWDCRGHGKSPGERGYAESYYHHVKDLDAFVNFISKKYGIPVENIAILANSVGAVTAAAWVHDYAPRIRAMVLAAPAFRIRLYIPFAIPLIRLLQRIKSKAFISSYVKSKMLTHDPAQSKSYDEDELITRNIAVNILLGLHDTSTRIMADAGAIFTPTLILSAGSDWVVKNSAQQMFFNRLSSPVKYMEVYPGFFHAVLYEKDRQKPFAKAREFILDAFKKPIDTSFLLNADQEGYTMEEFTRLQQSPSFFKGLNFSFQTFMIKTLGKLSTGIRLGWKTGFDSGKTLDYVYENTPQGITPLGRMLDKTYLNSVGWKGIRERGTNLKACLTDTIQRVRETGNAVRIMDVAAGPGRYVLDVLRQTPGDDITALLRDYDPANLEAGKKISETLGLNNVTFVEGDAFNTQSLLSVTPRPNITIVSGLYELFPENKMIRASLEGITGVTEPGGYLIYTGQPWHPQVELIARTLINRDGEPWIMRRRTQAEMDELVRSAGYVKLSMKIDSYGIFTVSLAQKR